MSQTAFAPQVPAKAPCRPQPVTTAPDFEAAAVQGLPQWWRAGQQEAWSAFSALPMPQRKNEAWRFADVSVIKLDGYQSCLPVSAPAEAEIKRETAARTKPVAGRVVYGNDHLLSHQPLDPALAAQGVVFLPLELALQDEKAGAILKRHFMAAESATSLGSKKFEALHRAFCAAGTVLYVPKGVEVKQPLEAFYWLTDASAATFPHTLVIAEDNASVELSVFYASTKGAKGGLAIGASDVIAGAGAKVRTVLVQNWDEEALSFQIGSTAVQRDGHAASLSVNLGSRYARTEAKSRMLGEGSRSDMFSLTASHGGQIFDQRTFQEHVAANTTSDLLYKNALADTSRTIFAGMISVDPGAQKTDAYQSNRNLLLSDTAEADSLPGLEIQANDVRCTHGSTSGQISPEEMFYMAQRGIPLPVARKLFVLGFFDEVLGRLADTGDGAIAAELHDLLEKKFSVK